jgi:hypothetical protein
MDTAATTNTVEVTAKTGEKTRISERKYLAAMRNLARANRALEKQPLSERKRQAIMRNLAKAWKAPRTPEGNARCRRNALKHGVFVRHLAGSFLRLGENPRRFAKLQALFGRAFAPRDDTETMLVKRLAEAVWRHLRTFRAAAVRAEQNLHRNLQPFLPPVSAVPLAPGALPRESIFGTDTQRAFEILDALAYDDRLAEQQALTRSRVERTLRLLIFHRGGNPRLNFYETGRRILNEIEDLLDDPRD